MRASSEKTGLDINEILSRTEKEYKEYVRQHCRFSFFHRHGESGIKRAEELSFFMKEANFDLPDYKSLDEHKGYILGRYIVLGKIDYSEFHLSETPRFAPKGKGNLNRHSYRSLLLKNIVYSGVMPKEDEQSFKKFLFEVKNIRFPEVSASKISSVLQKNFKHELSAQEKMKYITDVWRTDDSQFFSVREEDLFLTAGP